MKVVSREFASAYYENLVVMLAHKQSIQGATL